MRRALICLCAAAGTASAQPASTVTAEGGAEVDSNIQRVQSGVPNLERVGGTVLRAGFRADHRGRAGGGGYAGIGSVLARIVTTDEAKSENVALFAGDLRWLRTISAERPVSFGFGLSYADALAMTTEVGARTFRYAGVDAIAVLRKGDDRSLTISIGPRYFAYKPDEERRFDYWGPSINARLDLTLWEPSGGERSLELSAIAGFEARIYDTAAIANGCPLDAEPDPNVCFEPTALERRDRFQRVGTELTYSGDFIGTIGYLLSITDSNSFGYSIIRHRGTISATTDLPKKLIGSVLASLQIDQYADGLIVPTGLNQEFTNLDDANRSSLQFRLARKMTNAFSLEGRVAIWRDLGGSVDTEYSRELVYFGGVYTK